GILTNVCNISYFMPKVAFIYDLPVDLILGRDWQVATNASITFEPEGSVVITTPTSICNVFKPNTSISTSLFVQSAYVECSTIDDSTVNEQRDSNLKTTDIAAPSNEVFFCDNEKHDDFSVKDTNDVDRFTEVSKKNSHRFAKRYSKR